MKQEKKPQRHINKIQSHKAVTLTQSPNKKKHLERRKIQTAQIVNTVLQSMAGADALV